MFRAEMRLSDRPESTNPRRTRDLRASGTNRLSFAPNWEKLLYLRESVPVPATTGNAPLVAQTSVCAPLNCAGFALYRAQEGTLKSPAMTPQPVQFFSPRDCSA